MNPLLLKMRFLAVFVLARPCHHEDLGEIHQPQLIGLQKEQMMK
jgi:hypothetical protein